MIKIYVVNSSLPTSMVLVAMTKSTVLCCVPVIMNMYIRRLYLFMAGFLRQFNEIPDRLLGHCYASTFFAVGEFDGRGGVLYLKDSEPAQLLIPPGKINKSRSKEILLDLTCTGR